MSGRLEAFAEHVADPHAYLTTTGRHSGQPHEIEIWWAYADGWVYMISGGGDRSDWVRNLQAEPAARIRIGTTSIDVAARFGLDEAERMTAGRALAAKYRPDDAPWDEGFLVAFGARSRDATR